jgi:hypothetical protein
MVDPQEVALAREAQARGESAASQHVADALAQLGVPGGGTVVEAPSTPDDVAVKWTGTPGEPATVSPQPTSSPNVTNPLDNSQSQPG